MKKQENTKKSIERTTKPMGVYCPKEVGCAYNWLPNKKKSKKQEE